MCYCAQSWSQQYPMYIQNKSKWHAHVHVPCMLIASNDGDIPFHLHLDLSFLRCFLLWAPERLRRLLCHDYHCQTQTLHLILLKRITQHTQVYHLPPLPPFPSLSLLPFSLSFLNLSLTLVRHHMYLQISISQHWTLALVAASPLESCCQNSSQMHCRGKMTASPDSAFYKIFVMHFLYESFFMII